MLLGKYNPTCFLEVDGGINAETLPLTAHAGANVFVVGSAIFEAEDIPARVDAFKRLIASFS
jgi:ribulose-phosphate 3-epimerase